MVNTTNRVIRVTTWNPGVIHVCVYVCLYVNMPLSLCHCPVTVSAWIHPLFVFIYFCYKSVYLSVITGSVYVSVYASHSSLTNTSPPGIVVWVLTGDKQETAVSIGYSSQVYSRDTTLHTFKTNTMESTRRKLEEVMQYTPTGQVS